LGSLMLINKILVLVGTLASLSRIALIVYVIPELPH
jgi:hypothetical protein